MKIRVRAPNGTEVYDVDPSTAFGLFRFMLEEKCHIPTEDQKLMSGFPPKAIEANPEDTLEAIGLRSGDQLIVEKSNVTGVKQGHTDGKYIPPSAEKGFFVRRPVPADNTCMFHTAAYVLQSRSRSGGPAIRRQIAEIVAANPKKFTDVFLGQPNIQYCSWIQESDSWGGAIELSILSFLFCTEIVSLDVQTGRMDIYGQGEGYVTRVFILYTGRHYDAMALASSYGASESGDQVMFNVRDDKVMQKAQAFINEESRKSSA